MLSVSKIYKEIWETKSVIIVEFTHIEDVIDLDSVLAVKLCLIRKNT